MLVSSMKIIGWSENRNLEFEKILYQAEKRKKGCSK